MLNLRSQNKALFDEAYSDLRAYVDKIVDGPFKVECPGPCKETLSYYKSRDDLEAFAMRQNSEHQLELDQLTANPEGMLDLVMEHMDDESIAAGEEADMLCEVKKRKKRSRGGWREQDKKKQRIEKAARAGGNLDEEEEEEENAAGPSSGPLFMDEEVASISASSAKRAASRLKQWWTLRKERQEAGVARQKAGNEEAGNEEAESFLSV
uniref:DUF3381 domain-containing protein n=1 Tax=Globodera pallida TaxID=36090 RepID=A0A183CBZ1_GLOPA